jgi:hypothetical protein
MLWLRISERIAGTRLELGLLNAFFSCLHYCCSPLSAATISAGKRERESIFFRFPHIQFHSKMITATMNEREREHGKIIPIIALFFPPVADRTTTTTTTTFHLTEHVRIIVRERLCGSTYRSLLFCNLFNSFRRDCQGTLALSCGRHSIDGGTALSNFVSWEFVFIT